ncbi:MAG: lmo0937 family membrane protein [Candidatus Eremiobacteraeota bacterium]|nr:lmo0937 family membrane protein [Candidatus Eremiobacteraeota bacterium]
MLWAVVVILVIVWLVSFLALHVTSGLIHLLILAAIIIAIVNLVGGRRAV